MPRPSDRVFISRLIHRLADMAYYRALPAVMRASRQLGDELQVQVHGSEAVLYLPHYWAIYVHDGRGPFGPWRAQFLVWFRNPLFDPRLDQGRQPQRYADVKRLTPDEFYLWMDRNRAAEAAGMPKPMIVTKRVRTPTQGAHFFANEPGGGMYGFAQDAAEVIVPAFRQHVREQLADVLEIRGEINLQV